MIFAWEETAKQAKTDLDAARRKLCDWLSSYAGFTKTKLVVVFDGYKQQGNPGEKLRSATSRWCIPPGADRRSVY